MWLLVGLGNPGPAYEGTRHNLGARTVTALAKRLGCRLRPGKDDYYWCEARHEGEPLVLCVPTTYMNLSGPAVASAMKHSGAALGELVVVVDDFYLSLGRLRFRPRGGDGGHRGLVSVIGSLGSEGFARLRLGVGDPPGGVDPADWVLSPFEGEEGSVVGEMVERAIDVLILLGREGLGKAMEKANRWVEAPPGDDGDGEKSAASGIRDR